MKYHTVSRYCWDTEIDEIRAWIKANRMRGWKIFRNDYTDSDGAVEFRFARKEDAALFKLFWSEGS